MNERLKEIQEVVDFQDQQTFNQVCQISFADIYWLIKYAKGLENKLTEIEGEVRTGNSYRHEIMDIIRK